MLLHMCFFLCLLYFVVFAASRGEVKMNLLFESSYILIYVEIPVLCNGVRSFEIKSIEPTVEIENRYPSYPGSTDYCKAMQSSLAPNVICRF